MNSIKNKLKTEDKPIHGWYRFVLGYPPHLVREYLERLDADPDKDIVFDPFCGTATTPVEARMQGYHSISSDANPIALLAARTKLNWQIHLEKTESRLADVLELAASSLKAFDLNPSPDTVDAQPRLFALREKTARNAGNQDASFVPEEYIASETSKIIPKGFISDKPLLRVLSLRNAVERAVSEPDIADFFRLALANTIVSTAGNIGFGPEIYRTEEKEDVDVLGAFSQTTTRMASDLTLILSRLSGDYPTAQVAMADARTLDGIEPRSQIGIVITSPPYPNEKDYTRSTRLENVLLGYLKNNADLRALKSHLLRSNTRNIYVNDDDNWHIRDIPSIVNVADAIEKKRIELGKTSGFERQYHRVVSLYFGGMFRHLAELRRRLRKGARCAYVVGDQASFFRIPIYTAQLLADVAVKAGYIVEGIELWRTRRSTVTRANLDENVLILRAP